MTAAGRPLNGPARCSSPVPPDPTRARPARKPGRLSASDRRVTVPTVLCLHLSDDPQRAGPHLPSVRAPCVVAISSTRIPANSMPRIGEILRVESRRRGLHRFGVRSIGTSDSPAATASIARKSTSTGAFLETIASAWATVAGTAKT